MSKVDKMRGRLASIQRDREDFERQKKELETQMNIGRKNIDKIQKGLKNNTILNDPEMLQDIPSPDGNVRRLSKKEKTFVAVGAALSSVNLLATTGNGSSGASAMNDAQLIIPSGPRISDWCFTGPLDSAPPVVKSREMYENIRLLGRGAFGEVNLVKNIEDNKM
jgi:hypothetical protein